MRTTSAGVTSLVLGLSLALPAVASEPASHAVTIPTTPGQTVVVEWTGTALPGGSGQGTNGNFVDPLLWVPCPSPGPDDAHVITLTVPEGAYESGIRINADFHIEWDGSNTTEVDTGLLTLKDPDLVLSVYHDLMPPSSSDGGEPQENVSVSNPSAGEYTAVVCPFLSSAEVPYKGRLTLTALGAEACVIDPRGNAVNNGRLQPGGATVFRPDARNTANLDLFSFETGALARQLPTHASGRLQSVIQDQSLGVPTFLWARTDAPVAAVGALPERELLIEHARAHLRSEAKALRLNHRLIDEAAVADAQFNGEGPAVVRFRQRVEGIEVHHRALNVMLDRSYRPVAVSGHFAQYTNLLGDFTLGGEQAIAAAWTVLGGALDAGQLTLDETRGEWQHYRVSNLAGSHVLERLPRARPVYYARAAGLEPAYQVEIFAKHRITGQLVAYSLLMSAQDGSLLVRKDLKSDAAYSYRVFAEPKGPIYQPFDSPLGNGYTPFPGASRNQRLARNGGSTSLITLDHAGIVTGDPWLVDGAATTTGNNVNACADLVDTPVSGLISNPANLCTAGVDVQPAPTGANSFDYPIEPDENPANPNAQAAAVVNLFYMVNWLHDWWYNHGFNEAAGNAQTSNYGRGGVEGDEILAQGQDASGRNNANMATPSDGSSPTMQQYLFDGPVLGEVRQIAPTQSGPLVFTTIANAGDQDYDLEGTLELVDDGMGLSPSDGCGEDIPYPEGFAELSPVGEPYTAFVSPVPQPSLAGKIALIDRGNCNTTFKIQYALLNDAIGVIVVNNAGGDPPGNIGNLDIPLAPEQPTEQVYADMPTVIIRKDDGDAMKALIAAGQEVRVHMTRTPSIDTDGTLDNQIIAHEFFHYVHHRLTDSNNQQAGAMSEGWGDISGFMLSVRAEDVLVPGNDAWQGAYGLAGYVADNFWAGIRRAPYTTDFAKNAFTFKHISEGEPTPDGGTGVGNGEVHNAGEIWANMMYECYAGILTNRGVFGGAQTRMKDYIIAGLKMTPANATYTEARDAVLAATMAADFGDYVACSKGFARRGAGLNAQSPPRTSADLAGVVEDYTEFVCPGAGNPRIPPRAAVAEGTSPVVGGLGLGFLLPLMGLAAWRRRRRR